MAVSIVLVIPFTIPLVIPLVIALSTAPVPKPTPKKEIAELAPSHTISFPYLSKIRSEFPKALPYLAAKGYLSL